MAIVLALDYANVINVREGSTYVGQPIREGRMILLPKLKYDPGQVGAVGREDLPSANRWSGLSHSSAVEKQSLQPGFEETLDRGGHGESVG